jgi:hypothetical protein
VNETIDSTAANETITPNSDQAIQPNSLPGNTTSQTNGQPVNQNQSNPTSFLDSIVNPFKQLFGIK